MNSDVGGADSTIGIDLKKTDTKNFEAKSKQLSSEARQIVFMCLTYRHPSAAELLKIFEAYGKVEYIKVVKNKIINIVEWHL